MLALVAIVLVVYAPIVLGGRTWDDARYHTEVAPPRIAAADSVLHGELPTWWEGTGLGVPLLAEPGHGAAYPPGWIAATPRALDLLAIAHVLWCALGVALWARQRGASELGALVAGALVATGGIFGSAAIRGAAPALAHLPWLALVATRVATAATRAHRTRYAVAGAVLLGLIGLGGELLALACALVIVGLHVTRRAWRLAIVGPGVALACFLWLPAIATAGELAAKPLYPVQLARVVELVVPVRTSDAWLPTIYLGAPLLVLGGLGRPPLRAIVVALGLLVLAFVIGPGELMIAMFAIVIAAHAGTGFDRVAQWLARGRLGLVLGLVAVALAPTAAALPLLFPTTDRALVATPPAWAITAVTPRELTIVDGRRAAGAPVRVFRPITSFTDGRPAVGDTSLADAIATLAGTSAAKWGISSARSDDPARPAVHDRVWLAAASAGGELLARYGIALAILPASLAGRGGFDAVATRGNWALVRYPASPPAALVYEWIFAADIETALARLFPPGARRGLDTGLVVLAGRGSENQDEPSPPKPCTIERWSGAAIDLRCSAERPAYAVISSTALRGWSVEVDGRAAPWLTADVMRRAVAVPAGDHRVTWRYVPPGLELGLAFAALGVACSIALWFVAGRRNRARD